MVGLIQVTRTTFHEKKIRMFHFYLFFPFKFETILLRKRDLYVQKHYNKQQIYISNLLIIKATNLAIALFSFQDRSLSHLVTCLHTLYTRFHFFF